MQISLSFNPVEDKHEHVNAVVDAVYGVKTSPKSVSVADVQVTVNGTVAEGVLLPSTVNSPAPVAEFPNPSIAPTAVVLDTPAVNGPAGVELDKNGIPWDARIHSGGRDEQGNPKKNADGSWAKKKGVDDLTKANITKELQNLMAAQIGHAAPPAGLPAGGVLGNPVNEPHQVAVALPTDPNAFVALPIGGAPSGQAIAPMPAPVMEPAPVTLQPQIAPMPLPIPAPAAAPTTYQDLAVWLAPNLQDSGGKLSTAHVEHFCRQCNIVNAQGVGEFALVANRPDAVAWLYQAFTAQIAAS